MTEGNDLGDGADPASLEDDDEFRYAQTEQIRVEGEEDPEVERARNASCLDCGAKVVVQANLKKRVLPCPECQGDTLTLLPGWAQEQDGAQSV